MKSAILFKSIGAYTCFTVCFSAIGLNEADIRKIIQDEMHKRSLIEEVKEVARDSIGYTIKGAGFVCCLGGVLFGLDKLGSAYTHFVKSIWPSHQDKQNYRRQQVTLGLSTALVGITSIGLSCYGAHWLLGHSIPGINKLFTNQT